jgi:DNA-binding CsgD family transcriptional regulator
VPLGRPLLDTLERMGFGGILLGTSGQVLGVNECAIQMLLNGVAEDHGRDELVQCREALKTLLRSDQSTRFTMKEDAWIVIPRSDEYSRHLVLHAVPIAAPYAVGPHTVVVLVDLDTAPRPTPEALQKIFGLTPAEAKIAIEIARGRSLEEIAQEASLSIATVRKQLASIFTKTNTHRQAGLVALLARVSILP